MRRDSHLRPIRFRNVFCLSFRQLDELNAARKGTTFRAFKQAGGLLREGRDYFFLDRDGHAEFIDELRESGLIYPSTGNLVLITEEGYNVLCGRTSR
jgi:hypothetical protein